MDPLDAPAALEAHLLALCRRAGGDPPSLGFRRLSPSAVDARLFFADPRALDGPGGSGAEPDGRPLLQRLGEDPLVESVRRKGATLSLRFSDDFVARLGERLEGDGADELVRSDALGGRTCVVNFLNPNATKPLHVGHLRNVSLGMACAAALEACGARVVRQCYVCDIGRNVCEAMAGYEAFHGDEDPRASGEPPDRFVGRCYAEYARSVAGPASASDDPIAAEVALANDRADELVAGWMAGAPDVRTLWGRVRAWALAGQAATLARLGVAWDRVHFESSSMETVARFVARGLASGMLVRGAGSAVLYPSEREEYAALPLLREDGFPTEHARVIGLFLDEHESGADVDRWVVVCGDEWGAAGRIELEIAERLGAARLAARVELLAHGMVTVAGSKMKSRDGRAVLIDDLLDGLARSAPLARLLEEHGAEERAEDLVDLLVKGYFLHHKPAKALEFAEQAFTDEAENPAWVVARALCRARGSAARRARGVHDADLYRTAALQVLQVRQLLARTSAGFQGTALLRLALGLAQWYLACPPDPRLDAVVGAILRACLRSLGIAAPVRPAPGAGAGRPPSRGPASAGRP